MPSVPTKKKQKKAPDKKTMLEKLKSKRKGVIAIVFIALFSDYMLTTAPVAIMPDYLFNLHNTTNNGNTSSLPHSDDSSETKGNDHALHLAGLMVAKPISQILTNLVTGLLTNKFGYTVVLFCGCIVMGVSSLVFSFGKNYIFLIVARAIQGMGSAFASTAGLGLVATLYTKDSERGKALAIVMSGTALGGMVGPTFGGVLYEYGGIITPFAIIFGMSILNGIIQVIFLKPRCIRVTSDDMALLSFLKDPMILIACGILTFGDFGLTMLEPTLPAWMMKNMNASPSQQGLIFISFSIGYLINANIFGSIAHRLGRWRCAMGALIVIGLISVSIPFSPSVWVVHIPCFALGLCVGVIDCTVMPIMGNLVDKRHPSSSYGAVYALADSAICVSYFLGPIIIAPIDKHFGFWAVVITIAVCTILYAPLVILLRRHEKPKPKKSETKDDSEGENKTSLESEGSKENSLPDICDKCLAALAAEDAKKSRSKKTSLNSKDETTTVSRDTVSRDALKSSVSRDNLASQSGESLKPSQSGKDLKATQSGETMNTSVSGENLKSQFKPSKEPPPPLKSESTTPKPLPTPLNPEVTPNPSPAPPKSDVLSKQSQP